MASLGVLVLVGVLVGSAVAWQRGLDRAANAGADAALTYLVARGSEDAVERSLIEQRQIDQAKASLRGLEVAEELVHMAPVLASNGAESRVVWRGVSPETKSVRSGVHLSSGKWPEAADEVMVGQRMASELGIDLGAEVTLLAHSAKVVGIIDSRIGFAAGEIWMPLATLQEVSDRPHASKLVLRDAQSQVTFLTFSRPDIGLVDVPETTYLETVANGLQPLRVVAWIVAILLIAAAAAGAGGAAVARADARRGQFAARSLGIGVWRLGLWYLLETLIIAVVAWLVALWPHGPGWHRAASGNRGARTQRRRCGTVDY